MKPIPFAPFLFIIFSLQAAPVSAEEQSIGIIKTYQYEAVIVRHGKELAATIGARIYTGDTLLTRYKGAVGIQFFDGSVLSLGEFSQFTIDEYIFQPMDKEVSFLSRIKQGSVSFLSGAIGRISPESVSFQTPTATLSPGASRVLIKVE